MYSTYQSMPSVGQENISIIHESIWPKIKRIFKRKSIIKKPDCDNFYNLFWKHNNTTIEDIRGQTVQDCYNTVYLLEPNKIQQDTIHQSNSNTAIDDGSPRSFKMKALPTQDESNIQYAQMQVVSSPSVRIRDVFRALLRPVPETDDIFQAIINYGDSIGSNSVKFLLNEKIYESNSLINQSYRRYQGPALCAYFDRILTDQQWEDIFCFQDDTSKNKIHNNTNFLSIFRLSDFAVIASGQKIAFIDPSERLSMEERAFVAFFDLNNDITEARLLSDQFAPLFDGPLIGMTSSNQGTMIRLPIRSSVHTESLTNELFTSDNIVNKAIDFSNSIAELCLLFCQNITSISAFKTIEPSGRAHEQLFSFELSNQSLGTNQPSMRKLLYAIIDGAVVNNDLPAYGLAILRVTCSSNGGVYQKKDWILCARCAQNESSLSTEQMITTSTLYLVMPLHQIEDSEKCHEDQSLKPVRKHASYKPNSICREFYFNRRNIICCLVTDERCEDLIYKFNHFPIQSALATVQFPKIYSFLCRELVNVFRKHCFKSATEKLSVQPGTSSSAFKNLSTTPLLNKYISILYSLIPENNEIDGPLACIANEIWADIVKYEIFFSETEGWGFVAVDDMLIVNCIKPIKLRELIHSILKSCNVPVVDVPDNITAGLYSHILTNGNRTQMVNDADVLCSMIKQQNVNSLNTLDSSSRLMLLDYILQNAKHPAKAVQNLQLLPLTNNTFISFQSLSSSSDIKKIFLLDHQHLPLFNKFRDRIICNQYLSAEALNVVRSSKFAEATQVQTMSGSDFSEFIMLPNEWKKGDDVVTWPKHHQYFNLLWLENTWKYIRDNLPNDLGPIENYNLAYVNNHRERYITLYKLSRHQSSLLFCSKQCLLNPHMNYLQRALSKLDITVVDGFPDLLTNHADFTRYVPRLEPIGLMKILRNRLVEQGSPTLLSQSVNSLLSEKDIKCIRSFLSRLKRSELNHDELECLKHLPLFDNATCDVKEKYISLSSSSYLCYENGPRLPFLHSHCKKSMGTNNILCTGTRSIINSNQNVLRPCIHVQDQDSKKLLELLNQHPVEFGIAARQLVINLPDSLSRVINNSSNQGSNGISGNNGKTVNENVSNIGKWLLCNCERILLTDNLCRDCIRPLHLFHNQSRDLCSASQLIDPSRSDKYVSILGSRFLPANDLCTDHNLALLRSLGMRSIYELKGEEIVEICEAVRTMPKSRRQLLASLLLTVICGDFGKTLLSEPVNVTGGARCTVKVFLYSFPWVPISHKRPSNYPSSLTWKYDQHSKSTNDEDDCQFMAPHDVLDKRQAHIGGSEIFVSDLDIRNEHISKFAFKKCGVDIVVRHLKNVVSSYALMHDRVEYLEYLNITKECYDALQKLDSILVQAELHSIKLKEWIWNGIGSFSAPEAIFLIDKNHALAHFFTVIPYEMYAFVDFFERIGVSRFPLVTVFLDLLNNQSFESELFRKSRELQISFFKWAREVYTDRRVLVAVNDLEKKSASLLSSALNLNNVAHNISGQQAVAKSSFVDNQQKANTYLSDTANNSNSANDYLNKSNADKLFPHAAYSTTSSASSTQMVISIPWCLVKDQIGTVEALKFAISSIVKNEEIVINCTGGTGSAANSLNGVAFDMDHYRLYDEILLPNLNVFSRNVKDTIVLLALDNCDIHMMSILKKHLCIPVTPNGHTLRRPEKLVHPKCILSLMYSDVEGYFPYGSEDTYLRKDRLDVLRLLGMKFDEVSWSELAERAELIANVKDRQLANQKAHGLLAIFRLMLNRYNQSELLNNDEIKSACRIMSECAFYPVMDKPSQSYPLHWADKLSSTHLAKPCELIEHKYWQVGSATFPVCVSNGTSLEHVLLNFHKLTITDCLNQLHEISKLSTPLSDELIEIGYVVEVADACYSFIIQNSKSPDFNQTYVRDFFSRNRILLSNSNLYFSNQVFSNISQSVPPYFISQSCSGLPLTLLRSVLAIPEKPTLNQLLSFIRIGSSNCTGKTSGIFWTSQLSIFNLIGDIIDGSNSLAATNVQIPDDLPIPNTEGIMHPLFKFKQPHSCGQQQIVHSAVDYRFQKHTNIAPNDCINSVKLCLPESLNDNLKHILIHIDHASIDQRLRDALCDHDPNIILEFILAAERAHPIKYLLSNYHAGVLLSYFDDQLKVGAGNFQKLRELCLFRSIWPSHEVQTSNYMNSDLLTSIDQYKQVFMVSPQMAHLLASLFEKCPLCNVNSNSMSTCGGVGTNCVSQNYNNPGSCCVLTHWHNTYCYDQQFTARESFFGDISSRILSHLHIVALKDVDAFLQLCLPFLVDIQNQHYDSNKVRMAFRHLYECISPQQLAVHEQIRLQEIIGARLLLPNCENPPRFVQCSQLYHPHNADLLASFINVVNDVISNDLKYVHDYLPLRKTLSAQRIVEIGKDIEKSVHLTQQWSDSNRHKSECLYRLLTNCQQQMDELKNAGVNFANIAFLEPFQYTSSLVNILPLFESNIVHSTVLCLSEGIPTQYAQLAWSSSFVLPDFVDPKFGRSLSPQLVLRHLFNIGELLNNNINATSTHHDFKSSKQNNNLLGPPSTALFVDSQVRSSLLQIFKHIYQYLEECLSGQLQNAAATTEDTSDFWWSPSEILDDIQMRPVMYSENTGQVIESYKVALQLEIEDEVPPFLYAVPKSLLSCRKCSSLFQRIGCKNDVSAECYSKILCKMARVCYSDYLNSNEVRKVLKISELFFRSIAKQHPTSRSSTCDEFQFDGLFFLSNHLKLKKSSDLIVMDQRENMDYITKLPDVHFLFNPNESVLNLDVLVTPNDHKPFDEGLLSLHSRCANVKCIEKIVQSQRPTLFSEKFEENFSVTIPDDSQRHRVLYALERKFAQLLNSRTLHRCLARMLADAMARSKTDMRIVSVDEVEALLRSRMSLVRLVCCEYLEINLLDKYTNKIVEGTAEERAVLLTDTKQPNLHKIVGITDPSQFFFTLYISFKHAEQTYFSACLSKAILPLFNDVRQHVDKAVLASLISCSIAHMSRLLDLIGLCTDENILSTLKLNYIPGPGRLYGDEITLLHPFSSESHRLVPGDLCVYKRMSDSAFVYCRFIRFGLKTDSVIILADLDSRIDHLNFGSVSTVAGNSSDDIFVRYGGGDSNDPNINMLSSSTKWRKLAIETEITGANLFVLENWSRMHDAVDVNPISEQEFDQQETRHQANNNIGDVEFSNASCSMVDLTEEERFMLDNAKTLVDSELRDVYIQFNGNGVEDRKKRVKRLLLKWHPDKNQGNEKFASEVFKHLKKQVELYDIEMPNSSLGSFSSLFTNFKWPSSSAFNSASGMSSNGGMPGSTADNLFSSSKFGGSFDNIHTSSNGTDGAANIGSQGYTSQFTNAATDEHARSRSGTTTPPSRSNSFRTAREEWQWRRQQGFGRRTGFFTADDNSTFPNSSNQGSGGPTATDERRKSGWQYGNGGNGKSNGGGSSPPNNHYHQQANTESQRWLRQAHVDVASANNDLCPIPPSKPSYEWACYKCYRSAEKALKAYHYSKSPGKILATDIPTLLFGVDSEVRSIGYRLYKWLSDPNKMQYPNLARFAKIPNEVYTATQAEKSIEYTRELIRKVEEMLNRSTQATQQPHQTHECAL